MSIQIQVLGRPGEDNATLVRIDSGSAINRLLFDCGEKCLNSIGISEIQSIDHLFFSHFHMDHICGFDTFFRNNYNRPHCPVTIWGPPGTIDVIHHRMRGYTWNLHQKQPGKWIVNEVYDSKVNTATFYTREAFKKAHFSTKKTDDSTFLKHPDFEISFRALPHGSIESIAYRIDEPVRQNIDPEQLRDSGLPPGPWIKELKEKTEGEIDIDGTPHSITDLRKQLLIDTEGSSAAYLTDFILDPNAHQWREITGWLKDIDTLICESQYKEEDLSFAKSNSHMTTKRVGLLAASSQAKKLIIQHVSRRYDVNQWREMLAEAKREFANTSFPDDWKL